MFKEFDTAELRARFPLPDGEADRTANLEELAFVLNVSTTALKSWLRDGMPCLSEGTNGRGYEFSVADCYAWRKWVLAEKSAESARRKADLDQLRLKLHGDEQLDEVQYLTPKEQRAEYDAALAYANTAREQGTLVRAEAMRAMVESIFVICRQAALQLPDELERRLGLTPPQVETVIGIGHEHIAAIRSAIEAHLGAEDESRAAAE